MSIAANIRSLPFETVSDMLNFLTRLTLLVEYRLTMLVLALVALYRFAVDFVAPLETAR